MKRDAFYRCQVAEPDAIWCAVAHCTYGLTEVAYRSANVGILVDLKRRLIETETDHADIESRLLNFIHICALDDCRYRPTQSGPELTPLAAAWSNLKRLTPLKVGRVRSRSPFWSPTGELKKAGR